MSADKQPSCKVLIKGNNLSALRKLQLKRQKSGLKLSLAQLANQAIALGLKAAKERTP